MKQIPLKVQANLFHRDSQITLGSMKVFFDNDSGISQIDEVFRVQNTQEFLPKKISRDSRRSQNKWKENESRRERLKPKVSPFHKL